MINFFFFSFLFFFLVFGNVLAFKSGVLDVANSVICFYLFFFLFSLIRGFSICFLYAHAPVGQPRILLSMYF